MFKLSNADRENVVRISCGWCRQTRRDLPKDMIQLIGDVPVYHLADDMRCDNLQAARLPSRPVRRRHYGIGGAIV
jgi:hypothetical protein